MYGLRGIFVTIFLIIVELLWWAFGLCLSLFDLKRSSTLKLCVLSVWLMYLLRFDIYLHILLPHRFLQTREIYCWFIKIVRSIWFHILVSFVSCLPTHTNLYTTILSELIEFQPSKFISIYNFIFYKSHIIYIKCMRLPQSFPCSLSTSFSKVFIPFHPLSSQASISFLLTWPNQQEKQRNPTTNRWYRLNCLLLFVDTSS